mmetsp:Transcript_70154/g.156304  ORF Transcript_70154/g.156304 Transcript_70154/m.156304 type:complete len:112 (-) Transcript_70154:122-457(-)
MDVAYSVNGIAGVLEKLDRNDEAISAMEEAYRLSVEALGSESDPIVQRARKNLNGLRQHIQKKTARAEAVAAQRGTPRAGHGAHGAANGKDTSGVAASGGDANNDLHAGEL